MRDLRLLNLPEVLKKTGLSRSVLYVEMAAGRFPKPLKRSMRSNAWRSDEIDSWIEALTAARAA